MVLSTVVLVATLLGTADLSTTIGYLYEFDCKAIIPDISTTNYTAIAYKHEVGYIQKNNNIQLQTCAGDPSTDDIGTTQLPAAFNTTSMQTKTPKQTTTVQPQTTEQSTTTTQTATDKVITMLPPTAQITTTMLPPEAQITTTMHPPTYTDKPITMPPPTAKIATTMQPLTTETVATMQRTTAEQAITKQPTTTGKATTTQPTSMELSTKLTMKPVSSSIPLTTSSPVNNGVCPQIVQEHARDDDNIIATRENKCYEVMVEGLVSWDNAELDCRKRGGHLLDIASIDEQHFINKLLSNNSFSYNLWIGSNDRHHEEQFEWITGTVDPGSIVITTPLPSAEGNTKLCLTHNINHAKQFGGTLAQYGHSCYELLPNNKYTWSHGESICHSHGGDLAHISNSAEQEFIQAFMTRHSPRHAVWIGLHDLGREGHFECTSGNPVTYLNWSPGHFDNQGNHNVEDCVAFIPYEGGKWDDIHCGSQGFFGGDTGEKHPLLCQYKTAANAIIG